MGTSTGSGFYGLSSLLPITRVTVHRDGALVEREGIARSASGRIVVGALPLLLDEASLRVAVEDAALREVRLELDPTGAGALEPPDEGPLRAAERRRRGLEARRRVLEEQQAVIAGLAPARPEAGAAPPTAARVLAWSALEQELGAWSEAIDAELREVAAELGELAQRASGRASPSGWEPRRRMVLVVDGEGDVRVRASYRIEGACWAPAYTLRTDATLRHGHLLFRALVAQATGEDWTDARVSLSTAPCRRLVDLPELTAMRLGPPRPVAGGPWRELPSGFEELFPAEPAPTAPPAASSPDDATAPMLQPLAKRANRLALPTSFTRASSSDDAEAVEPGAAEAAGPLLLDGDVLDYPKLRLAPSSAPRGQRGRLERADPGRDAREQGLPEAVARHVADRRREGRRRADAIASAPLPMHAVLPGPVAGADVRYDAEGPVDLPSDGRFHVVAVRTEDLHLDVRYRALPRLDPRAFRTVTATRSAPHPLLPGPVDVLVDGAHTLTVPWGGGDGAGPLEIALGVEPGLRLTRRVAYREETVGLFAGERRLHTEITVEVRSSLSRSARLDLVERVPIAADEGVTVAIAEADPAAEPWEGAPDAAAPDGGRVQRVDVPPGGKATARFHYTTTLGSRMEIVGGPRRG